jgi:Glyoxalase/Bleomycin resistance protein/Dioxygenase superfamily
VSGDPDAWRSLGLVVTDDGHVPLYGTSLRIVAPPSIEAAPAAGAPDESAVASGITGWTLSGADADVSSIDGLSTSHVSAGPPLFADHPLGAIGLDHVVVMTSQLERTSEAITAATGCELRRIREVGTMRQGFHRIGSGGLIVELVERPDIPEGPAAFWGIVINVDDLDAACALLGADRISVPKDAVQPGRRIATIRGEVGLGLPVALMTP